MKQALGIFAAIFMMPAFSVQAWLGGPWSFNSYQPNGDDGVYEAVATMTNGTGMYRWAVHNNNTGNSAVTAPNVSGTSNVQFGGLLNTYSPHVWYYRGLVYYGRCFGIVSSILCYVHVTGNASAAGTATGQTSQNGVALAGPGIGNTPATNAGATVFGGGNNQGWCNSTFTAKISQKAPVKRFNGHGQVSFFGAPSSSSNVITFPNGTVHVELFGGRDVFNPYGHIRRFIVYGAQVSYTVNG